VDFKKNRNMDNLNQELQQIINQKFCKKRQLFSKLQECLTLIEEIGMESYIDSDYFVELEMDRPLDLADLVMTATTLVGIEIHEHSVK